MSASAEGASGRKRRSTQGNGGEGGNSKRASGTCAGNSVRGRASGNVESGGSAGGNVLQGQGVEVSIGVDIGHSGTVIWLYGWIYACM